MTNDVHKNLCSTPNPTQQKVPKVQDEYTGLFGFRHFTILGADGALGKIGALQTI